MVAAKGVAGQTADDSDPDSFGPCRVQHRIESRDLAGLPDVAGGAFLFPGLLLSLANRHATGVPGLFCLSRARAGINVYVALEGGYSDLAVNVGDIVLRPLGVDRRNRQTAYPNLHRARGIHRQRAVVENKFVTLKLDHGFWTNIGGRSCGLDPGHYIFRSLDQIIGKERGGRRSSAFVQHNAGIAAQDSRAGIVGK